MKNEQWDAIHAVFEKMDKLSEQLVSPTEERAAAQTEVGPAQGDNYILVNVRAEIRKQLDFLRAQLAEQLNERDLYLVLFPVVAHFDELIQTQYLKDKHMELPSLQHELFQIDDAGELFFETLDDILRKPQTNPFIFEVFYLCLSNGFCGKYADNLVRINEYLKKLREKIPLHDLDDFQSDYEETSKIKPTGPIAWYYAAAVVVIAGAYFLFYMSAKY
jgi:type IV/VI secretion system ImpK/VasF family protein